MAVETRTDRVFDASARTTGGMARVEDRRDRQAFRLLQFVFVVAPTVAGLDKFARMLTDWDKYLAPQVEALLPFSPRMFMLGAGVIEIAAGLLVAVKPRLGAYVVAAWLGAIIVNLLVHGQFLDIALREFGLMLGALALGRLAGAHGPERRRGVVA